MPFPSEASSELHCWRCGYDLRAHRLDEKCPECGTSVAESRRMATIPRRPPWRDSDPRWRRRMLAGVWILVLLPLMDVLKALGWGEHIRVPNIFGYGAVRTLSDTFIWPTMWSYIPAAYAPIIFCMGIVLLFSKERGRRRNRLDWTRPWGVFSSYIVFVLSAISVLFITGLVAVGISALFLDMPPKYQPGVTMWFVRISAAWIRYGPQPTTATGIARAVFSSLAILLACIPLFDALRGSGPKNLAAILLTPLALFALFILVQAGRLALGILSVPPSSVGIYGIYFRPEALVGYISPPPPMFYLLPVTLVAFLAEAVKWCLLLTIAIWLTFAQLAARRERRRQGPRTEC